MNLTSPSGLCPFHLEEISFELKQKESENGPLRYYACTDANCREPVPAMYVTEYGDFPPVVLSAVGFRGHGKTVYFTSLLNLLLVGGLHERWSRFCIEALDEESLKTVHELIEDFRKGKLSPATPQIFPRPTMLRLRGLPGLSDTSLLVYDTSGESFRQPSHLIRYARYVKRASTVLFLVNLSALTDPGWQMHELLNTYVIGMAELGAELKSQHLIVVYTAADDLPESRRPDEQVLGYLLGEQVSEYAEMKAYFERMRGISGTLLQFTEENLKAMNFANLAREHFADVQFSMVSALGAKPNGRQLPVGAVPRRVLDPLLWVMEKPNPGGDQCGDTIVSKSGQGD